MPKNSLFGGLVSLLLLLPLGVWGVSKFLPSPPLVIPALETSERVPTPPFRDPGPWETPRAIPVPPAETNAPVRPVEAPTRPQPPKKEKPQKKPPKPSGDKKTPICNPVIPGILWTGDCK